MEPQEWRHVYTCLINKGVVKTRNTEKNDTVFYVLRFLAMCIIFLIKEISKNHTIDHTALKEFIYKQVA